MPDLTLASTTTDPVAPAAGAGTPASASQAMKAQLQLREAILSGDLPPSARLTEMAIVERLGMSRTPVRTALARLAEEGLLESLPGGGYSVRTFREQDVADAIELRGVLEGMLARRAAERGARREAVDAARQCLNEIDAVLAAATLDDEAISRYEQLNDVFHQCVQAMAQAPVLQRELDRVVKLPFASPSAFVIVDCHSRRARDMLTVAQHQHWQVLDAIAAREGARAEALLREHCRIAQRNLQVALHAAPDQPNAPGVGLIRRR